MSTVALWNRLLITSEKKDHQSIDLSGTRLQLRADAHRFDLWGWKSERDRDNGDYAVEINLHGAQLVELSDDSVTYRGFLDESKSPFGNADGTRTMRRVEVMLCKDEHPDEDYDLDTPDLAHT